MNTLNSITGRMAGTAKIKWALAMALVCVFGISCSTALAGNILGTKHNLAITGPGDLKATTETNLCIFCHTVHKANGQTPLWNHTMSTVTNYVVYSSPTLKAVVGQPDGSSRLCLSCHDGTIALGSVSCRTTPISMQGGVTTMPGGRASNLGTDLSGDHPISFVYDQNLVNLDNHIKNPALIDPKLKLDPNHKLQCSTCHDAHNDQFGNFLVMDNTGSALCTSCHVEPGWSGSAHSTATVPANPSAAAVVSAAGALKSDPHTTVATGCETCHVSHKAGSKARLLIRQKEEQNCFVCHNGKGLTKDLTTVFNKVSAHPVLESSSTHTLAEDPVNGPRHTACADCHNPHATAVNVKGGHLNANPLAGVKGMSSVGAIINPASREYELCFRCHADSLNRGPARVARQFPENNKRNQFKVSNQSFHPLESTGRNPNVPSLIAPWTTGSLVTCTDCHNNDQGTQAGGSGPNGPHGSAFTPILERQLLLSDNTLETAGNYALCYKCHNRSSILSDQSFRARNQLGQDRGHRFHIVDQKTSCTTCHDSHGVQNQAALINFNTLYATPSSNGRLEYVKTGAYQGNCSVTCHGKDHNMASYPAVQFLKPAGIVTPSVPSRLNSR